jgi:hypothetical protein
VRKISKKIVAMIAACVMVAAMACNVFAEVCPPHHGSYIGVGTVRAYAGTHGVFNGVTCYLYDVADAYLYRCNDCGTTYPNGTWNPRVEHTVSH